MARPLAVYHITSRGDGREDIYVSDEDRMLFLDVFAHTKERFGWLCHAYCLMGNHYHLLIETPQANLSRGMRHLNGVYTQRFNRRHGRVGHVFQGRFKSILVEKDAHLLALCRYIVRNPVAAGMVEEAGDWQWSSYRATAGIGISPKFLTTSWILSQFGDRAERYAAYVADAPLTDATLRDAVGSNVLGGEDFRSRMQCMVQSDGEFSRAQRLISRPDLEQLKQNAGDRGAWMTDAYRNHGYTMREIAHHQGVHYSLVGKIIRAWETTHSTFQT